MTTRQEIDQKYLIQQNALETEFFKVVNKGKPGQHRELRAGKSIDEFNSRHAEIWHNHEQELIGSGYLEPFSEPIPTRDLAAEIDGIEARLEKLES